MENEEKPDANEKTPEISLEDGIKSAVPPTKIKPAAQPKAFNRRRAALIWAFIAGMGIVFYLAFAIWGVAYENMENAERPMASFRMEEIRGASAARDAVFKVIGSASREIAAVLPTQYNTGEELLKLLGMKALNGVNVIAILPDMGENTKNVRGYLEYFGKGKVSVADLPCTLYATAIMVDGRYLIKSEVPIGNSFGKGRSFGRVEFFDNPNMVASEKARIASMRE